MSSKFEIRPKGRVTLVGIEIIILSFVIAAWLNRKYEWDGYVTIISGIVAALTITTLFFGIRLFRYILSILFSLFWGYCAFQAAASMTNVKAACLVTFGLIVLLSLALHKDYFEFESG